MLCLRDILKRLAICITGTFVGVLMIPMFMIIFMEGESVSETTTMVGIIGSILLLIGGIVGASIKRWITLLPGTILVLTALALSIQPILWIPAVMAILLLLSCLLKTGMSDRKDEHSNLMDDFDRCFDVDDRSSDGKVLSLDIDIDDANI
jgi:hypothetical protein